MKICKFWKLETGSHDIHGEKVEIKCYGGSNLSIEDAARNAKEKIEKVKSKIEGKRDAFEDYEVEIREEPLETLDDDNIVTRNRYGARVLNSRRLMFLDIDQPRLSFWDIFSIFKKTDVKAKIIDSVKALSQRDEFKGLGFRVYETRKGVRVIVLGRSFDAKDKGTRKIMRRFNCDWLYTTLCMKQDCFRARLTPKPYRMRIPTVKVQYPRGVEEEVKLKDWLSVYDAESVKYCVCKFIGQFGDAHKSGEIVKYHDEATGAHKNLKLA